MTQTLYAHMNKRKKKGVEKEWSFLSVVQMGLREFDLSFLKLTEEFCVMKNEVEEKARMKLF
jgi:hypothetical protein